MVAPRALSEPLILLEPLTRLGAGGQVARAQQRTGRSGTAVFGAVLYSPSPPTLLAPGGIGTKDPPASLALFVSLAVVRL